MTRRNRTELVQFNNIAMSDGWSFDISAIKYGEVCMGIAPSMAKLVNSPFLWVPNQMYYDLQSQLD